MDTLRTVACSACSKEFSETPKYLKTYRLICRPCKKLRANAAAKRYRQTAGYASRMRAYYASNYGRWVTHKRLHMADRKAQVNAIKSAPCTDCKNRYPPCVMDFDHIGDNKVADVGSMLRRAGMKKILAEIAKCELVCSNCHRIRTEKRRTEKHGRHPIQSTSGAVGGIQRPG